MNANEKIGYVILGFLLCIISYFCVELIVKDSQSNKKYMTTIGTVVDARDSNYYVAYRGRVTSYATIVEVQGDTYTVNDVDSYLTGKAHLGEEVEVIITIETDGDGEEEYFVTGIRPLSKEVVEPETKAEEGK